MNSSFIKIFLKIFLKILWTEKMTRRAGRFKVVDKLTPTIDY